MASNRTEIPCRGGLTLVAEASNDPKHPAEVYISVERNGKYIQDIAVIKQDELATDSFQIFHWDASEQGVVYGRPIAVRS